MIIDKNIPLPGTALPMNERIKNMHRLAVGDSFAVSRDTLSTTRADMNRIHTAKNNTKEFTIRMYEDAYRCWRVK